MASLVQDEAVIKKAGLPGQSLLRVTADLDMACQRLLKMSHLEAPLNSPWGSRTNRRWHKHFGTESKGHGSPPSVTST